MFLHDPAPLETLCSSLVESLLFKLVRLYWLSFGKRIYATHPVTLGGLQWVGRTPDLLYQVKIMVSPQKPLGVGGWVHGGGRLRVEHSWSGSPGIIVCGI